MRLISFDVGIKNLAYCVFSFPSSRQSQQEQSTREWSIPEWNCANLLSLDVPEQSAIKSCCHMIKGKRKSDAEHPCNKNSKWVIPNTLDKTYCELHAKMQNEWIIPTKRHTTSYINKLKLLELEKVYQEFANNNAQHVASLSAQVVTVAYTKGVQDRCKTNKRENPLASVTAYPRMCTGSCQENADSIGCSKSALSVPNKKMKKNELIERIMNYYESKCFRNANENVQKAKTAGETDLITIGRAIRRQLDEDPATEGVTHVIIENQISTIAARMKTIQGMIAQYFIMRFGDKVHIEFVSSHNKLKEFRIPSSSSSEYIAVSGEGNSGTTEKTKYKANKSDGIAVCRRFFESNPEMNVWASVFDKSKKRDDLADCFLQGVWYLKSNKIISYADNLKINSVIVS